MLYMPYAYSLCCMCIVNCTQLLSTHSTTDNRRWTSSGFMCSTFTMLSDLTDTITVWTWTECHIRIQMNFYN